MVGQYMYGLLIVPMDGDCLKKIRRSFVFNLEQ